MTNRIEIDPNDIGRVQLRVAGDNNVVIIKKLSEGTVGKVSISLAGNDCSIILDDGIFIGEALNIYAGQIHPNFGMINNAHIYIGKGTSFEKTTISTANANSSIEIGERRDGSSAAEYLLFVFGRICKNSLTLIVARK